MKPPRIPTDVMFHIDDVVAYALSPDDTVDDYLPDGDEWFYQVEVYDAETDRWNLAAGSDTRVHFYRDTP